jgi:hypothetical protein
MFSDAICRALGETKVREMFLELTSEAMKKVARQAGMIAKRSSALRTPQQRNREWSEKVWRLTVSERIPLEASATLLYEWLLRMRRPLLVDFLGSLGVQHDNGMTDADFMTQTPAERLREVGIGLLARHDRREAAAYLLFLDAQSSTQVFAGTVVEAALVGETGAAGPARLAGEDVQARDGGEGGEAG